MSTCYASSICLRLCFSAWGAPWNHLESFKNYPRLDPIPRFWLNRSEQQDLKTPPWDFNTQVGLETTGNKGEMSRKCPGKLLEAQNCGCVGLTWL